ncbi:MAG: hypothetical protein HY367_01925, partial [Candidatus Aenigmarchaeota archaeon]|nr:hypothetical protein [Candidatus Aenigmarchaeota archaeon]
QMKQGFNLIGYPSYFPAPVNSTVAPVNGTFSAIFGFDPVSGNFTIFDPSLPPQFNTLQLFEPGRGYWVNATENTTWIFNGTAYVLPPVPPFVSTMSFDINPVTCFGGMRGFCAPGDFVIEAPPAPTLQCQFIDTLPPGAVVKQISVDNVGLNTNCGDPTIIRVNGVEIGEIIGGTCLCPLSGDEFPSLASPLFEAGFPGYNIGGMNTLEITTQNRAAFDDFSVFNVTEYYVI